MITNKHFFLRMALMLFISILSLQAQAQSNKNKQQGSKKSGVYKAPVTGTVYNADTAFAAPTPKKGRPHKTTPVNQQQGSTKSGMYKAPAVTGTVYNADTAFAAPTPKKGRPKKTSPVSRKRTIAKRPTYLINHKSPEWWKQNEGVGPISLHTLIIYYIQNGARQNILLMSFASSPSKNKTSPTG